MTDKDYQSDFEKGLSTLEDIQMLAEFSVSPLVSHAYYYLSEMKRKADAISTVKASEFNQVAKVLDEKLFSIVGEFFGNKGRFKEYSYSREVEKIDLKKWNLVLETIPEILSIVTLFNYHGGVDVRFNEGRFLISGLILQDGNLERSRKLIYVITRKLLRSKVLLTFNLEKTARTGLFKLDLKADISHDEALTYKVQFNVDKGENYMVGFSNVFCQYRSHLEDVKLVGEHNIVEIRTDLSVKHYLGIPELSRIESANKEILHFPFLFRPLSIILPMKGNLTTAPSRSLDDENKRKQDVSKYFRTIDFFSLFNL
ncbi:MAG: hypothetical protein K2Q18_05765 [Bdellovibrionales bacterium]|nr:hypothetical protein [Bdellovibrionales bacterium]